MEYFAQTLVPIITACAMIILVLLTGVYAWLTYRLVGETARQNRPYVFLKLGPSTKYSQDRYRQDLLLVNSGSRVARDIVMEVIRDAKIYVTNLEDGGFSEEDAKISSLELCRQGLSNLPPLGEMTTLGFVELSKPKMTPQRLEYIIRYRDGSGRDYTEKLILTYFW